MDGRRLVPVPALQVVDLEIAENMPLVLEAVD
jgi:hypothetical protein